MRRATRVKFSPSRFLFAAFALMAVFHLHSFAQSKIVTEWNEPYVEPNQLGTQLEKKFQDVISDCGVQGKLVLVPKDNQGNPLTKFKDSETRKLSSVPRDLQKSLIMNRPVWWQDRIILPRLFSYVYNTPDINTFDFTSGRLLYEKDLTADPASMLPKGIAKVINGFTCSGVITAASKLSGGGALPFFTLEGALSAEYSGNMKLTQTLIEGEFHSPFGRLMEDNSSTSSEQLEALLTLWHWYDRNDAEASKPQYILTRFEGVALFGALERKRDLRGNVSFSGKSAIPFVSVNADLRAETAAGNFFTIDRYSTGAYLNELGKPKVVMMLARTPQEIRTAALLYRLKNQTPVQPIYRDSTVKIVHEREGIPSGLCETNYWQPPQAMGVKGTLTISSIVPVPTSADASASDSTVNPNLSRCRFTINYKPADSLFDGGDDEIIEVAYSFKAKKPVAGVDLVLDTETASFTASQSPRLGAADYRRLFDIRTTPNGEQALYWEVNVSVTEDEPIINWDRTPEVTDTQVVCGQNTYDVSLSSQSMQKKEGKIRLVLQHDIDPTENLDLDHKGDNRLCKVTGKLRLGKSTPGAGPLRIERSLPNLPVWVPRVKPAIPAPGR